MINKKSKLIIRLLFLTFILYVAGWVLFVYIIPHRYLPVFPLMLLFFLIVTLLVHLYQIRLSNNNFSKFTRSSMLATVFKLIAYSVFAIVYLAINSEKANEFIVVLFILYIIFSTFEVIELTKYNRNLNRK